MPMMSLAAAAQLVYKAVKTTEPADEEVLNDVAQMVASRTDVLFPDPSGDYSRVMPGEIVEGQFENAGSMLTFTDGRAPITGLCIRHEAIGELIADIEKALRPGR